LIASRSAFRGVHRRVCRGNERVRVERISSGHSNADARADPHDRVTDCEGAREHLMGTRGDPNRVSRSLLGFEVRDEQQELVPADARDNVGGPSERVQRLRRGPACR
jgi:hypothetical protein